MILDDEQNPLICKTAVANENKEIHPKKRKRRHFLKAKKTPPIHKNLPQVCKFRLNPKRERKEEWSVLF